LIVGGLAEAPDPVDPAVAQDMHLGPKMVLLVRAGPCIPRAPSLAVLPAPVDGPPLALPGLVSARVLDSVRLAPASAAQAV
jgi:hypothetical protein